MLCPNCGKSISVQAAFCKYCGVSVAEVQSRLVDEGYAVPSGSAETVAVPVTSVSPKEKKPNIFSRLGGTLMSIIVLIVIYGVVNGVLWLGQEAFHHEDNVKLEQMKSEMSKLDTKIKVFESSASAYGATEQDISRYKADIDRYNVLVDEYNKLAKDSGTRWYVIPIPGRSHESIK